MWQRNQASVCTLFQKYNSKIIKAGALLPDTKALLSGWDIQLSPKENLKHIEFLRQPRLDGRQMAVCADLEIHPPSNRSSARLSAVAKSL